MCSECQVLRARVQQLERKVQKQAKLLKLAARIIKKQRQQLDQVQTFVWGVISQARRAMAGHLPRGTWSLWRGRLEVAQAVYHLVRVNWSTTFWELLGHLSGL